MNLEQIEQNIGYYFKDKALLKRALTLSSADDRNNNQTLEFFGDAILEFLVSERIYDETATEGSLTERRKALVSDTALEPVSRKLGLDKALIKNPYDNRNKKSVPSAYEALVAAIYLDGGIDAAREFVLSTLNFESVPVQENYIGKLQELMQGNGKPIPVYKAENIGTPQSPMHRAEVEIDGKAFCGTAVRVQDAKQLAAQSALEYLKPKK